MDFAAFDDDLFEEKPSRGAVAKDYVPRMCESVWFMNVSPDQLVSQEDELGVKKFTADYLYFKKSYDAAAAKYEEILNGLAESSIASRRECEENLARCHIKGGTPDKAVPHAENVHSTSKTQEQLSVSYSLLLDAYLAVRRYDKALTAGQNLLSILPDNGHFWMKLGYVYACIKSLILPNVTELLNAHLPASASRETSMASTSDPSQASHYQGNAPNCSQDLQNSDQEREVQTAPETKEQGRAQRDVQIVAACLQRAYYILHKTEGTSVGFALTNTKFFKEKLVEDLRLLLDDRSLKDLRHSVHQNDKVELSGCSSESSDSNSQGNANCQADEEDEGKVVSGEKFEEKWFKWIL